MSAAAWLAVGDGRNVTVRVVTTIVPFAGWPLTATMSAKWTVFPKFFAVFGVVRLGSVANFVRSEVSSLYCTKFSTSILRITGEVWARMACDLTPKTALLRMQYAFYSSV